MHLQSFASKIFFDKQTGETTSNLFPFVWETWIILTRNRLLVDIFLTRRLSKSLAFCEFASVNFEPCNNVHYAMADVFTRTIARWRHFTTTTRILDFVVFLCKFKLLFVLSSAGLTNLNNKAKPNWILVVVVKYRHLAIVLLGRREITNLSTTPFDSCQLLKHDVKTFMYPKKMLSMQAALKLEI